MRGMKRGSGAATVSNKNWFDRKGEAERRSIEMGGGGGGGGGRNKKREKERNPNTET
jgi:hypothetical protein